MSRIGRKPIPIPKGTKVAVADGTFTAEGPKGKVVQSIFPGYPVAIEDGQVTVARTGESGPERSKHGLLRALLANAVAGAATGFVKDLEISGVGYKAELKGNQVQFALGYSHPIVFDIPEGVKIEVDTKAGKVSVSGADRQKVGQVAAEIRNMRRPDPYKAKGVKYAGEILRRKVGKAGGK
jgi:large subunit ribosomal protein L6